MAKRVRTEMKGLFIGRVLLIALLCVAVSYIMRHTWASPFFESAAIVLGIVWCMRVINTGSARTFRLMATLVLVLIWSLLTFYLGAAHGLFNGN